MNKQQTHMIYNQQNLGSMQHPEQGQRRQLSNIDRQKEAEEQVYDIERKSFQILFQAKTVFPFDFFPDTITINANKIDVVHAAFFASHEATSIPLQDIANVQIQTAPFFATLQIINIRNPMEPVIIRFLKKAAAIKAKNIIDGLLIALSHGADLSRIEPKRFLHQLEKAGESTIE